MKIELRNISFTYKQFGQSMEGSESTLKKINLKIGRHEIIGIVGASGSGKTTLIQMLNGLLEPNLGTVLLNDRPAVYSGESAHDWRRRVAIVFQFPEMQFFENSIFDEIAFALRNQNLPEDVIEKRVMAVAGLLALPRVDIHRRSPFHLSEGQKRRVAIASILVLEPDILIFDEPTAGLDFSGIAILKKMIENVYLDHKTVILVSHDMDFVAEMCQRIVSLSEGKVVFDGAKADFFLNEDLLRRSHLELPHILKLARQFFERGSLIKFPVFSLQELQASLKK